VVCGLKHKIFAPLVIRPNASSIDNSSVLREGEGERKRVRPCGLKFFDFVGAASSAIADSRSSSLK